MEHLFFYSDNFIYFSLKGPPGIKRFAEKRMTEQIYNLKVEERSVGATTHIINQLSWFKRLRNQRAC